MTSVFISYSRADQTFARRLFDALEQHGRDTWIDWEDIPYSADWWREICTAIDAAETVIVILTPDSLASRICTLEVEYARSGGKRIIPIVHRTVDERGALAAEIVERLRSQEWESVALENWRVLGRLNWLNFREGDDFDRAFAALEETIDRDLEYAKAHTRLLIRAREWESYSHSSSRLLRGDDLSAAEVWLAASGEKTPQPAGLHVEFITASRANATRQQRLLVAALSVGIVLTAALAIFGFVQSRAAQLNLETSEARGTEVAFQAITATIAQGEALDNARTAVANAATATVAQGQAQNNASTAVAAQATADRRADEAQSVLWSNYAEAVATAADPFLALPLALAANRIPNPPAQAQHILAELAYSADVLHQFVGTEVVNTAAFSPDESKIVSSDQNGRFSIWDTLSGELLRRVNTGTTDVYSAFYSPDGTAIVTASYISGAGRGAVAVWDTTDWGITWRKGAEELGLIGGVSYAIYSPDGATIATGGCISRDGVCNRAKILLLDALTGETLKAFEGHQGDVDKLVFSPDGTRLVSSGDFGDGTLMMWDVDRTSAAFGEGLVTYIGHAPASGVRTVDYSPDGQTLLSGGDDNVLIWWDAATGNILKRFEGHTQAIWSVTFSPDGRYALSGDRGGLMILWDLTTGAEAHRYEGAHTGDVSFITFSADGGRALSGSRDGTLVLWNMQTVARQRQWRLENHLVTALAYNPDGKTLLSGGLNGELVEWDTATGEVLRQWDFQKRFDADNPFTLNAVTPQVTGIAFSADGTHALVSYGEFFDGNTLYWNLTDGFVEQRFEDDYEYGIGGVAISPDGKYALVGRNTDATSGLWNITTGQQIFTFASPFFEVASVNAVTFTSDSQFAITAHDSGVIRFWDVTTDKMDHQIKPDAGAIYSLDVSPDGRLLLAGAEDHSLILWELQTGRELRRFAGHSDKVNAVAFSPDGTQAVSAAADNTAIRWDVATGAILDRFPIGFFSASIAFSPDGKTVAVSGGAITLRQLESLDDLIAWTVANRPVRELTCAERLTYTVPPYCAEDGTYPTRTPFLIVTSTAP